MGMGLKTGDVEVGGDTDLISGHENDFLPSGSTHAEAEWQKG